VAEDETIVLRTALEVDIARTRRWVRACSLVLFVVALALILSTHLDRVRKGPDLLRGRAWRTSSTQYLCDPGHFTCGWARSAIFFHTRLDTSPWIDFDLGTTQFFNQLTVVNREDCCSERAVPLVFEVSDDREHWRAVAHHDEPFRDWDARFSPVRARYVRLRVARRSALHLVRVSLYRGGA
jgi:hypothetical protein